MGWSENVNGIQHVGIPTENIGASVDFYSGLGFEAAYQTVNDGAKVVFMRSGNLTLEIYETDKAAGCDGAINHFAVDVKDIEAAFADAKAAGLKILEEITYLPFWDNGVKFFIVEGPDKERVEFAQYL
jgi:lactoylglutathione lyase